MKKLLAAVLSVSLVANMTGFAFAEEPAENIAVASGLGMVKGQPEGWTEADATESITVLTNGTLSGSLNSFEAQTSGLSFAAVSKSIWDPFIGQDESGNRYPYLVESYELNDEGTELVMKLRDGVFFTNGDELNADDIVFTYDQILHDTEHYAEATTSEYRQYYETIEEVDQKTFKITFSKPNPRVWNQLTGSFPAIDKDLFEQLGYDEYWKAENLVGTGPYTLVSYDGTNSICDMTIRTDENGYWGYDFNDTYTNVKDIRVMYSPEETSRESALRAGEADIITNVAYDTAGNLTDEGYKVLAALPTDMIFLQLAVAAGDTLENEKLREALSLCIDRQAIVDAMLSGYATPLFWPAYTEGILGYEDESEGRYYQYDPERAKELVAESGYDGHELNFIYSTSTVNIATELAQVIQSYAAQVGINLKVNPLEDALYEAARPAHEYDVCLSSIILMGNMWYLTAADLIGQDRFNTGLQDEELKALGVEISTVMDAEKQAEIFKQMYDIEMTTFQPHLYLYSPSTLHASAGNIQGVQFNGTGSINLTTVIKG